MLDIKRHKAILDPYTFNMPIFVIGCGGMGSRISEGLIRMGLGIENKNSIILCDDDSFESHNLTNQWASTNHICDMKVDAVRNQMLEINPEAEIIACSKKIRSQVNLSGIVFMCVDSMEDRRIIIDKVLGKLTRVKCVIETRMDASAGISHCFNPRNQHHLDCWRMYWHSDREAQNIQGCGGAQSIISAIYATTAMALKQFEQFARYGNTDCVKNRVYQDFDECVINTESWRVA